VWPVLAGSGPFWEGPVPQQLFGSKKSSPSREGMVKSEDERMLKKKKRIRGILRI
jgi:hypothetical protein